MEFIKTNHSIQDAAALAIYSPAGIVVHTGDFKVDYTRYLDMRSIFRDLVRSVKRSTGINVRQYKCRETGIYHVREDCWQNDLMPFLNDNKIHRIIIATFASNVDRVQQIINAAYKNGRKVIVEGRSMVNIIGTASELGYINIPDKH